MNQEQKKNYVMRNLKSSDLFKMSRILKKMNLNDHIKFEEGLTAEQFGQKFFITLMENLGNAEDEFNALLADLVGITEEEFSELDIEETFEIITQFKDQGGIKRFLSLLK